jgi:HlyD family secretion protein
MVLMQSSIWQKTGKLKPWVWGSATVGFLGASAIAYLTFYTQPAPEINLEKDTILVKAQNLPLQVKANGVVQPVRKINVSPKEPGKIVELLVREGDRVAAGQIIARMDNEQVLAQVGEYRGVLARTEAELAQRLAGNRPEEIAKAKAEVIRYQAQLREARSRFQIATERLNRRRSLAEQGALSRDALTESLTEEVNAKDNLAQIQASLMVARQELIQQRQGARVEEIAQSRAQVAEAISQLQVYQIQLANTLVRAPFAGVITRRFTDVGDFITPTTSASTSDGATSASIAELSSGLEVEAKVPEASIARIKLNQTVAIRTDSYPDQVFRGRVRLIAPRALQENNITSFRVRVSLQTGLALLKSGMNTKLAFMGQSIRRALVVPLAAVVTQKEGQKGVWLVNSEGETRFKTIQLGAESGDQAQILTGLKAGDRVLLSPPVNQPIPGVDNTEGTGL